MDERRKQPGRRQVDRPQRYGWLRTIPTTNLLVVAVITWFSFCLVLWAITVFMKLEINNTALGIMITGSVGQALGAAIHYKAYRNTWQREFPPRE